MQSGKATGPGLVARYALGIALVLAAAPAFAQVDPGMVIRTIDASLWSPPAPDTAGITYRPDTGELITCDSEVDEMPIFAGVNIWTHTRTGVVTGTAVTTAFSNEPTGISWDPAGGRLWTSDDDQKRIYEIKFGSDGVWNTADDVRTSLRGYNTAGCDDLEDVAYDNLTGHLYASSGASKEICEIAPGPNGVFNGAASFGDDVVTTYSIAPFGINDVEGIVYDPFWNTLVVADRSTRDLYELTPQGGYLRKIDVNFPGGTKPSGVTIAPGSTNPMLRNYWVTDRRLDNNGNPNENDGRIYEVVAIPLGGNGAPIVDAGPPHSIDWPQNSVSLSGYVSDDGHPYPPSVVASLWSKLSGPGSVTFGSASIPQTTATFSAPGSYVLQLEGDDSVAQTVDTVSVVIGTTVTLSASTFGPGTVSLSPPGGSYQYGETVTLTATPNEGAGFAGWSGDLSGTTSPQQLLMNGSKAVTANFATIHHVSVDSSGPGSVTLDPAGGSYAAGTVVTVTATPGPNAVFDGFAGALSGTSSPQQLVVDGDKSLGASFTQHYTLALSITGPGGVTLSPPTGPYAPGTSVTLTAAPNPDAAFLGWSGDLSGGANPESLVMDGNRSVGASFATLYDVSASATGPGTVTLDPPGGTYPAGTVVTATATPDPGAAFLGWSGARSGTTSPQQLVVDGDKSLAASFAPLHTLSVGTTGPGSVTLSPPGGSYTAGTLVTLIAVPGANAVFNGWGGALSGNANPETLTVNADTAVSASFTQLFTVTATSSGPGSVSLSPPNGPYPAGSIVTVTALPDPDAAFLGWSGDLSGTDNPAALTIVGDESVTASFATLYDVSVGSTGPGTVTLDPPGGTYPAGSVVTVTATPDANAVFDGFTGALAGTASPQLLTVDADKTIAASFTSTQTYALTVTVQGGGTVTISPPAGPYPAGSTVTLTPVPSSGSWTFKNWSGDALGSANPLALTMDANKSVLATFGSSGGGGGGAACGIGPELAAALPLLAWLHRRRRTARSA